MMQGTGRLGRQVEESITYPGLHVSTRHPMAYYHVDCMLCRCTVDGTADMFSSFSASCLFGKRYMHRELISLQRTCSRTKSAKCLLSTCDGTIDLSANRRVEMDEASARLSGFPIHFWRVGEKYKKSHLRGRPRRKVRGLFKVSSSYDSPRRVICNLIVATYQL